MFAAEHPSAAKNSITERCLMRRSLEVAIVPLTWLPHHVLRVTALRAQMTSHNLFVLGKPSKMVREYMCEILGRYDVNWLSY